MVRRRRDDERFWRFAVTWMAWSSDSVERKTPSCRRLRTNARFPWHIEDTTDCFSICGWRKLETRNSLGRRSAKCPQLTSWSTSLAVTGSLSPAFCDVPERIAPVRKYYFNEVTALSGPLAIRSRNARVTIDFLFSSVRRSVAAAVRHFALTRKHSNRLLIWTGIHRCNEKRSGSFIVHVSLRCFESGRSFDVAIRERNVNDIEDMYHEDFISKASEHSSFRQSWANAVILHVYSRRFTLHVAIKQQPRSRNL
jgi:hypothetical protein